MEDEYNCNFDCFLLTMGYAIMTFTTKVYNEKTDKIKINMLLPLSL